VLPGPQGTARRIASERPWWIVWYGQHTRKYWAAPLPSWITSSRARLIEATTPEALEAGIATFEMFNPSPNSAQRNLTDGEGGRR
jgi:hypothetical protein